MAILAATSVTLDSVVSGGRRFVFSRPIEVEVSHPDSTWVYWHHETRMNSYGRTREEAFENFAGDVAYCWDAYAQMPDNELGPRAREAKAELLELIVRVEAA